MGTDTPPRFPPYDPNPAIPRRKVVSLVDSARSEILIGPDAPNGVAHRRIRTYIRIMLPWPIRCDTDTWLCMRNDPVLPKAIIKRVQVIDRRTNTRVEKYRAVTWDLDPSKRMLIGYFTDVGQANDAVLFDIPKNVTRVTGTKAFGMYS